jgi:polyhydroxyalkanoate synthesis regulator phasin
MNTENTKKTGTEKKLSLTLNFRDMYDLLKNAVFKRAGFTKAFEQKLDEKIADKVKKGVVSEEGGQEEAEAIKSMFRGSIRKIGDKFDSGIERTLKVLRIATVRDLKEIETKLDLLNFRLAEILDVKRSDMKTPGSDSTSVDQAKKATPKASRTRPSRPKKSSSTPA